MTDMLETMQGWLGHPLIADFGTALIAVVLGLIAIRLLQGFAVRSIAQTDTRYRVRKFIGLAGYVVLVLVLIAMLSSRLGQLSVIFGVAGAGIAFSLQEVIASLAGWIAISFGGFYRPGDRVQVGGITGDVIDIGMLRTTIMETGGWVNGDNYNGRIVKVANSFIFKEPVYNYTGDFNFLWDEFTVPVKYGSDWHLAQQIIEKAVAQHTEEFEAGSAQEWQGMVKKYLIEEASTAPSVTLFADENWITFSARYVVDFQRRRSTKDAIMRSILTAFEGSKGKVEFAGAAIEITGIPPVQVALNSE